MPSRWARRASLRGAMAFAIASETHRMMNPSRPKAGGAFTKIEPSFDTLCRVPGTAVSVPADWQLPRHVSLAGLRSFDSTDARASHAVCFTCSARTTQLRSRKGDGSQQPRAPSVVSWTSRCRLTPHGAVARKSTSRVVTSRDFARRTRTHSPCPHRSTRQRYDGFLQASSFVTGSPCELRGLPTTTDAKMRPTDFCLSTLSQRAPTPR